MDDDRRKTRPRLPAIGAGTPRAAAAGGPRAAVSPADPLIGLMIDGRYRVEQLMGSGGMSRVYRGTAIKTGVPIAVKMIDLHLSSDPAMQQRCLGEAKAMMSLQSSHVVHALDVGSLQSGQLYIVMELLDGEDLDALLLREGPLPWPRVADIGAQICSGMATAHRRNIVHRDIKPQNCFRVTVDDNPEHIKIIDFGVARDLEAEIGPTQQGFLVGTPEYMAPELVQKGVRADARTDVYAIGVTLYKLLTGVVPFRGPNPLATLEMHVERPLVPPSAQAPELEIPPEADQILGRALAKTPEARYATAEEMARALRAALGYQRSGMITPPVGTPIERPPRTADAVQRAHTPPVGTPLDRPPRTADAVQRANTPAVGTPLDASQASHGARTPAVGTPIAAPAGPVRAADPDAAPADESLHTSTVPWKAARSTQPEAPPDPRALPVVHEAPPPGRPRAESTPDIGSPVTQATAPRPVIWRTQILRAVTLASLSLLFIVGTWWIRPRVEESEAVAQTAPDGGSVAAAREAPKIAQVTSSPPISSAPSNPPAPQIPETQPLPEQPSIDVTKSALPTDPPTPRATTVEPDTAPATAPPEVASPEASPSEGAPGEASAKPEEPKPEEPKPGEPSTKEPSSEVPPPADAGPPALPEPDFPYNGAKKLVDEQQAYLRSTCLAKGGVRVTKVKLRFDVSARGRAQMKVFGVSDKSARDCVRKILSFPFDSSPNGGAFIYTLTESGSTLQRVAVDRTVLK